ncbi:sulfite exporter TauE/SafE family protein [Hahella ganghwensis]|uniref:sulfite exporter TauE/SafE family protein n=1 Tax=Hahella ganghwensis TaxID=286420 RepID=UPI0003618319|nr:sulfite exporter TauE/SafE family protein [Hahella ganghwensis]
MEILLYIAAGASVGFLVGLTGVGGGSLMTPLLILFGFPPHIAIGTDLLYAAITKATGVAAHARHHTINWKVLGLLAAGSIPASILTTFLLSHFFTEPDKYSHVLTTSLGLMLIVTSAVLLFKNKLAINRSSQGTSIAYRNRAQLTVLMGLILGVFVTLSSVGAGAIGTAVLMILYPSLAAVRVVGTDLAHAVPLTLIAGLGHMQLGNVDYYLLGSLLIGSLPAIHLGTKLSKHLPANVLRPVLASMLLAIGVKYAFF